MKQCIDLLTILLTDIRFNSSDTTIITLDKYIIDFINTDARIYRGSSEISASFLSNSLEIYGKKWMVRQIHLFRRSLNSCKLSRIHQSISERI